MFLDKGGTTTNWKQIGMGLAAVIPGAGFLVSIISIYSENLKIDVYPLLAILLYLASLSIVVGIYFVLWGFLDMDDRRDKKIIYNYLYDKTKIYYGQMMAHPNPIWVSTIGIANAVNLNPERVRKICYGHDDIEHQDKKHIPENKEPEDKWAIKRFVDSFEQ